MTVHKRWYDYDPLLIEVMELLKNYKDDLKEQAEVFLQKIETQVSKEVLDSFYAMVKPATGNRWYDDDPVLSKTVELLRIIPPEIQRKAAQNFLESLKRQGITPEIMLQEDLKDL
jgi:hypothetical protein